MIHIAQPPASVSINRPLASRVMLPVVSALEQISLSPTHSRNSRNSPPPQGEDMVTDKDQMESQVHEVS